ncbi:major facilitator superfamily transporter [Colletotrichum graminicola M1.001]|uniref:Major facilitator superfamily transporter n=1 Tax=Colletotrichum graminicola (strain M1.001 / M2 / FGSC 10212) TaxID=645133 RepID=E3QWA6_COLGM|nr:major facilitator superfamily transporter [Colletotrichum graminicola M1.001]EFQ35140.1 major facilitator superfamily transporter [Colletotrichum graminicola M1.001]
MVRRGVNSAANNTTETGRLLGSASDEEDYEDDSSSLVPGLNDIYEYQQDRIGVKVAATAWSFIVLGLFVSTIGVIIPHLQQDYQLDDIHVSSIFLVGPLGYCFASSLSNRIHRRLGQRGIAIIGPACHFFYAATGALHPPFSMFLVSVGIGSFGMGLLDGSWCAWVAGLKNANTLSGILHGSFSIGAAICPYIAGILFSENNGLWYQWFYVLVLLVLCLAFRHEDAERYRNIQSDPNQQLLVNLDEREILNYSATWVYSAYLLADVGTESTVSGWVVAFMLRVRHTSIYISSVCSSGFWVGMAVGRLALGLVTDKLGARRAVIMYLLLTPVFIVIFTLVRVLWVSVLTMSVVGFFMGPLFPSCIVQLLNLLPRGLHVGAVSFVASVGQIGGAILPYLLGVITQAIGLCVFPYMLLAQFMVMLLIWTLSLTLSRKEVEVEEERQVDQAQ